MCIVYLVLKRMWLCEPGLCQIYILYLVSTLGNILYLVSTLSKRQLIEPSINSVGNLQQETSASLQIKLISIKYPWLPSGTSGVRPDHAGKALEAALTAFSTSCADIFHPVLPFLVKIQKDCLSSWIWKGCPNVASRWVVADEKYILGRHCLVLWFVAIFGCRWWGEVQVCRLD